MFGINKLKKEKLELQIRLEHVNTELQEANSLNRKLILEDEAYRKSIAEKEVEIVNLKAEITEFQRVIKEQNESIDKFNNSIVGYVTAIAINKSNLIEGIDIEETYNQLEKEVIHNLFQYKSTEDGVLIERFEDDSQLTVQARVYIYNGKINISEQTD